MRQYLRELPQRDLAERRRFVVVATGVSFVVIVVVWLFLVSLGRQYRASRPQPTEGGAAPSPTEIPVTPAASPAASPAGITVSPPSELPAESPTPSPVVLPAASVRSSLPVSSPRGTPPSSPTPPTL